MQIACLCVLLALTTLAVGAADVTDLAIYEDAPALEDVTSKAEQQYLRAIEIRDNPDVTTKDLKRAVDLLYASANIEHLSIDPNATKDTNNAYDGLITADSVKLQFRNNSIGYFKAIRELIYVFRDGDGAPFNPAIAHRLLQELAAHGDPTSQADLAVYLALGIEPVAPNSKDHLFLLKEPDVPAALIHYQFAAKAGDGVAAMALGYRHFYGDGVPKSCQTALMYYEPAATSIIEGAQVQEGLPAIRPFRLSYTTAHSRSKPSLEQEFLHYQWFADFGHADAARAVAHLLSHGAVRDFDAAIRYLQQAAETGDPDSMAHLGHLYAAGIAVADDGNATAWKWFWKAAELGHPSGFFGLAYMHLTGIGADQDNLRAYKYFRQAVEAGTGWPGHGDALFYLGLMYLKGWGTHIDINQAVSLFTVSSKLGNVLASYNLAVLHLRGSTGEKPATACVTAVNLLKKVAERGISILEEAHEDFEYGEYEWALLNYLKSGEIGVELGQSNAAWLINEGYVTTRPGAESLAVSLLKRAAGQGNMGALLTVGDSYWYGKGVEQDWSRAAKMYADAGQHRSAQALFNLGYMHQFGAGLPKDHHLAKRYYDRAGEALADAWLAVWIALWGLQLQGWWEGTVQQWVPRSWAAMFNSFLVIDESKVLPRVVRLQGGPRSLWQQLNPFRLFDALDQYEDFSVIVGLAAVLLLVLWRRQAVRHRQAQFFNEGVPVAAAPAAAAPVQAQPQPDAGVDGDVNEAPQRVVQGQQQQEVDGDGNRNAGEARNE